MKTNSHTEATVSSRANRHSLSVRVSSLLLGLLMLALFGLGFFAGSVYGRNQSRPLSTPNSINRHFALGLVVYSSPSSITIDNERTGNHQTFTITAKTLVSINGSSATPSQIRAGDIVLLRYVKNNKAMVILVNSSFSD